MKLTTFTLFTSLLAPYSIFADVISVNFHTDDIDQPKEHILAIEEIAGLVPIDGSHWNNVSVGAPAAHNDAEAIFTSTVLGDDQGNLNAATIQPSADSTFFVGYAASRASDAIELALDGNDDKIFNSYLALNGPSGDGSPADAAILEIGDLSDRYTDEGYRLIIYSDSDRGPSGDAAARTSVFTLTPEGEQPISFLIEDDGGVGADEATFSGEYILSDNSDDDDAYSNYIIIEGLTTANFTLELTSPEGGGRAAISGFQIVTNDVVIDPVTELGDPTVESIIFNLVEGSPEVTLFFTSTPGETYAIDFSTSLQPDEWFEAMDSIPATGTLTEVTDSIEAPLNLSRLFYRVRLEE